MTDTSGPFAPFIPTSPTAAITNVVFTLPISSAANFPVLPFPTQPGTGAAISGYPWVVIYNESGTPVTVAFSSLTLGVLPPGMCMKYNLGTPAGQGSVRFFPQSLDPALGGKIYGAWYSEEPPGDYPASFQVGDNPTLLFEHGVLSPAAVQWKVPLISTATVGGITIPEPLQPQGQGLGIRLIGTGGTADGLLLSLLDSDGHVVAVTTYPATLFSPWWTVPWYGDAATLQIDPMLGGIIGATWAGFLNQAAVPGVFLPSLGQGGFLTVGAAFSSICPGGGVNTPVISAPPSGYMVQVRFISVTFAVAPAANALLTLQGSVSGVPYWQSASLAVVNQPVPSCGSCNIMLGASGQNDPAEGLNFVNNANQAATVTLAVNILPYPQSAGTYFDS
jgi:hypothetical protein